MDLLLSFAVKYVEPCFRMDFSALESGPYAQGWIKVDYLLYAISDFKFTMGLDSKIPGTSKVLRKLVFKSGFKTGFYS